MTKTLPPFADVVFPTDSGLETNQSCSATFVLLDDRDHAADCVPA